jgi:hypothetical protein
MATATAMIVTGRNPNVEHARAMSAFVKIRANLLIESKIPIQVTDIPNRSPCKGKNGYKNASPKLANASAKAE